MAIWDRSNPQRPFAVFAETGRMIFDAQNAVVNLFLEDGDVHLEPSSDEPTRYRRIAFETFDYSFSVSEFLATEAEDRRAAGMPPFGRLAALILSGPDIEAVDRVARALARSAPQGEGIEVLGPAPAPLAILRGRHRRRFLLKCRRDIAPQPLLRRWLAPVKPRAGVRLQIDIDPYSFL